MISKYVSVGASESRSCVDKINTFNRIKPIKTIKIIASVFVITLASFLFSCEDKSPFITGPESQNATITYTVASQENYQGTVDSCEVIINPNGSEIYHFDLNINDRLPEEYVETEDGNNIVVKAIWNVRVTDGETIITANVETDLGIVTEEHIVQATWTLEEVMRGLTSDVNTFAVYISENDSFVVVLNVDSTLENVDYVILNGAGTEIANGTLEEGQIKKIYTIVDPDTDEIVEFVLCIDAIYSDGTIKWKIQKVQNN